MRIWFTVTVYAIFKTEIFIFPPLSHSDWNSKKQKEKKITTYISVHILLWDLSNTDRLPFMLMLIKHFLYINKFYYINLDKFYKSPFPRFQKMIYSQLVEQCVCAYNDNILDSLSYDLKITTTVTIYATVCHYLKRYVRYLPYGSN